jgi:poly-gamma-glutamate system protein
MINIWHKGRLEVIFIALVLGGLCLVSMPILGTAESLDKDESYRVMELKPIIITGIASSTWGATEIKLSILDMEKILSEKGVFPYRSVAVSMGGELDQGTDYFGHEKETFLKIVERSELPLIYEESFSQSVAKRLELYDRYANGEKIKLFVNIGGASVNIGRCLEILRVPNGLIQLLNTFETCPPPERGVLFKMAERDLPIIHLLNVKELATRYGLPLDPIPLPEIGKGFVYFKSGPTNK